ncbi:hypothetical protein FJZ33_07125 [Candidatus Poribacteria bacterium]|nr:hypothetical protein [Candidatus Poribacteria bacterium]
MKSYKIVAMGDSITNGIRVDVKEEDTFRHLTQENLSRETGYEIKIINAGVNGDITTTAIHRLKKDVLRHNPDYVTIMYGVNDAGYYRPVTDSMADTPRVSAQDFKSNLEAIVKSIQNAGSKPILVTPVPMNKAYAHRDFPAYMKNGLNYFVDSYSDIIRDISFQNGIPLIDVHLAFTSNAITESYVPDGIHPNKDGHRFIADLFVKELMKITK